VKRSSQVFPARKRAEVCLSAKYNTSRALIDGSFYTSVQTIVYECALPLEIKKIKHSGYAASLLVDIVAYWNRKS